jgi:hypothetical protein
MSAAYAATKQPESQLWITALDKRSLNRLYNHSNDSHMRSEGH